MGEWPANPIIDAWQLFQMFNFGGNPLVLELLQNPATLIEQLLQVESFPAEFRACNPALLAYMDIAKYSRLVEFVTREGDPTDRSRSFKYPLAAAEILSTDNPHTLEALLKDAPSLVQRTVTEERWVEKEVDECDSQYYSSDSSRHDADEFFEIDRENIPPPNEPDNHSSRSSVGGKVRDATSDSGESKSRRSLGSSNVSVTSDDFPFVEEVKKTVKVKEVVTKKVQVEIQPPLKQLLSYLETQINYVLTGYVTRVLELILKKQPRRVIREIFGTKSHKNLAKHIDSPCFCDFVANVILCSQNEACNGREYFLTNLIKGLVNSTDDDSLGVQNKSMVMIVSDIVSKLDPETSEWHRVLLLSIYKQPSLPSLVSALFSAKAASKNKQTCALLMLALLRKVVSPILINPPNTAPSALRTAESESTKQLRKTLLDCLEGSFKSFIDRLWQSIGEAGEGYPPSYVVVKQLELLNILVKHDLFWCRKELESQELIFPLLVELCRRHPLNNSLHNLVFDLLRQVLALASAHPDLFNKCFNVKSFVVFCLETISGQSAYRGQCIYLCEAIRHSDSETVRAFKQAQEAKWAKIEEALGLNVERINRTLGGFSMRRGARCVVMFNKNDILARFDHFLKGELPEKKPQLQDDSLQDINSQGSAEWSDWNEFSNYSADEVDDKKYLQ